MSIFEKIKSYSEKGYYPFHMPGHKRNKAAFSSPVPFDLDITEIPGFDNLHHSTGILKDAMEQAAKLFGADASFFLVNGSSGGILAAIRACTKRGDTLIMSRGCHRSAFHGAELCGLQTVYLQPDIIEGWDVFGSVSPERVERALQENPACKVVFITSPTYEGVISDIKTIAEIVHRHQGILIVDEAHGAHLGFGEFPPSAIQCGADLAIQSLHKTLPSPTQTGILHMRKGCVREREISRQLSVFETSSPSYLLMGAIADCVHLLEEKNQELFSKYLCLLENFYKEMARLKHLRIFQPKQNVFAHDMGKILISVKSTSLTGPELARILRERYALETEMSTQSTVLAMTSIFDTKEGLDRLKKALFEIDATVHTGEMVHTDRTLFLPEQVLSIEKALLMEREEIRFSDAVGKIAADYLWAYPPGIPLIVPGEIFSSDLYEKVVSMMADGVEVDSAYAEQEKMFVVKSCAMV